MGEQTGKEWMRVREGNSASFAQRISSPCADV